MRSSLLILIGALLLTHSAQSAISSKQHSKFLFIEAGAYGNNLKERFNAPSGFSNEVSSLKGFLRLHPGFSLGKRWYFEPSFGTMVPTRDGVDGSTSVFESNLALQLGIPLFSALHFRLGPGIEWQWLLSKAGTVTLNNGTGTSSFSNPARSTHVFLFTATAGFSLHLHNRWTLFFDVYVPQVMNQDRRRFNASATLGFRI